MISCGHSSGTLQHGQMICWRFRSRLPNIAGHISAVCLGQCARFLRGRRCRAAKKADSHCCLWDYCAKRVLSQLWATQAREHIARARSHLGSSHLCFCPCIGVSCDDLPKHPAKARNVRSRAACMHARHGYVRASNGVSKTSASMPWSSIDKQPRHHIAEGMVQAEQHSLSRKMS